MRFIEFLKEDYLDLSKYGSWIDTNARKVYSVQYEDHSGFIKKNPELFGLKGDPMWDYYSDEYYQVPANWDKMFHDVEGKGWVRITHERQRQYLSLLIEGFPQYVKKSWPLIRPSTKYADIISVDMLSQRGIRTVLVRGSKRFELPYDRGRMIRFFTEAITESLAYEYGAWIDTVHNKVYKTDFEGHSDFIFDNYELIGIPFADLQVYDYATDLYRIAFDKGWLRVLFPSEDEAEMYVQGRKQDMGKAWPLIRPYTKMRTGYVTLDFHPKGSLTFTLPEDRGNMIKFFTGAVNEEYVDRVPNTYNLGSTEVFRNPSQTEFRKLLRKYSELRSFIDPASGNLYAWNTKGTLHEPAMEHFNIKSDIFLALLKDAPLLLYSDEVPRKRKTVITSIMLSNPHLQRLYGFSGFRDVETDKWVEAPPTAIAEMNAGKDIDFRYDITGHHHGQDDGMVYAFNPETNGIYGQINWTSYQNETYINHIEVRPEFRRQGIARMMIEFLKKKNEEPFNWGMTTPEGTELRKAIGDDDETR